MIHYRLTLYINYQAAYDVILLNSILSYESFACSNKGSLTEQTTFWEEVINYIYTYKLWR